MKRFLFLLVLLFTCACVQMERDYLVQNPRKRLNPPDTLDAGGLLPPGYGIPMNNPYEIHIMQRAIDSLCIEHNLGPIILLPTDVYVRFLPKDSLEYNALLSLDTELFDYPLTYEFPEGMDSFRDPSVPDTLITWQYTIVPYRTILPDIQYEVLDTCYIPPEEPDRSLPSDFYYRLEMLADSLANPTRLAFQRASPPSRAGVYPCGSVKVKIQNDSVPVKGVKVRAQSFVKVAKAFTTDGGFYQLSKKFLVNPIYSVHFENSRGFSEYGTGLSIEPTWEYFGFHSYNGYNMVIPKNCNSWFSSVVNNAIVDYYDESYVNSSTLPPSNMRLLLLSANDDWSGGTPMLNEMGNAFLSFFSVNEVMMAFAHPFDLGVSDFFATLLKYFLPDMIIRKSNDEDTINCCIYHEFSHASHYAKSGGASLWIKVIGHMVRNHILGLDLYGDGMANDEGENASELTEAWAYASEMMKWGELGYNNVCVIVDSLWFRPAAMALFRLMKAETLSRAQVLNMMTSSVESIDDLRSRLMMEYTSERYQIGRIFSEEGALTAQTRWRIINNSDTTLSVTRRWGYYVDSVIVSNLDTVMFSAMPTGNSSFYSLLNSYYYPDEITIRRRHDSGVVFHQLNKVTTVPMHHPFFNTAEWNEVDKYFPIGHTSIRDYDYTISSTDIY